MRCRKKCRDKRKYEKQYMKSQKKDGNCKKELKSEAEEYSLPKCV
jgi:hypothetical protein